MWKIRFPVIIKWNKRQYYNTLLCLCKCIFFYTKLRIQFKAENYDVTHYKNTVPIIIPMLTYRKQSKKVDSRLLPFQPVYPSDDSINLPCTAVMTWFFGRLSVVQSQLVRYISSLKSAVQTGPFDGVLRRKSVIIVSYFFVHHLAFFFHCQFLCRTLKKCETSVLVIAKRNVIPSSIVFYTYFLYKLTYFNRFLLAPRILLSRVCDVCRNIKLMRLQ